MVGEIKKVSENVTVRKVSKVIQISKVFKLVNYTYSKRAFGHVGCSFDNTTENFCTKVRKNFR